MAEKLYKSGDLVELVSGGPVMTVETHHFMTGDGTSYRCSWFAGAKHNKELFAEAALKRAVPKP